MTDLQIESVYASSWLILLLSLLGLLVSVYLLFQVGGDYIAVTVLRVDKYRRAQARQSFFSEAVRLLVLIAIIAETIPSFFIQNDLYLLAIGQFWVYVLLHVGVTLFIIILLVSNSILGASTRAFVRSGIIMDSDSDVIIPMSKE